MGKKATGGGESRELIPARTYLGIVCGAYDLGTQKGYNGGDPVAKFLFQFELHYRGNRRAGPQPARDSKGDVFTISKFVAFYLGSRERPSDLLKLVEAVERRQLTTEQIKAGVDVETLLDRCSLVVVAHDVASDKTTAKIESFAALDPDDEEPEGTLDSHYFEIRPGSREIPDFVPKFVAPWIEKSREFGGDVSASKAPANGKTPEPVGAGVADSDLPF